MIEENNFVSDNSMVVLSGARVSRGRTAQKDRKIINNGFLTPTAYCKRT